MKVKDKVAIITGASKGIGAEIAKELAREGADVVINYNTDVIGAKSVKDYVESIGRRAIMIKADIGKYDEVENLINQTIKYYGKINILINNAGIAIWKPFFEITEEIWDKTIDTNLKGTFMASQFAAREMKKNGGGVIVNISSLAAQGAMDCLVPYCASKGGMTLITKAMAVELAQYDIRVNTIAPGTINIERNRKTDPNYPDDWIPFIPMGRVGKVEDIAKPVVFLCTDDAAFITGQNIFITGGQTEYIPMPRSDFARK